jgi:hypothetical protein
VVGASCKRRVLPRRGPLRVRLDHRSRRMSEERRAAAPIREPISAVSGGSANCWRGAARPCRTRPSRALRQREFFRRFAIETVATRCTVSDSKWSDVTEIVVTGPSAEPLPASRDLLSFFGRRLSCLAVAFAARERFAGVCFEVQTGTHLPRLNLTAFDSIRDIRWYDAEPVGRQDRRRAPAGP